MGVIDTIVNTAKIALQADTKKKATTRFGAVSGGVRAAPAPAPSAPTPAPSAPTTSRFGDVSGGVQQVIPPPPGFAGAGGVSGGVAGQQIPAPPPTLAAPIKKQIISVIQKQKDKAKKSQGFVKNILVPSIPEEQLSNQITRLIQIGRPKEANKLMDIVGKGSVPTTEKIKSGILSLIGFGKKANKVIADKTEIALKNVFTSGLGDIMGAKGPSQGAFGQPVSPHIVSSIAKLMGREAERGAIRTRTPDGILPFSTGGFTIGENIQTEADLEATAAFKKLEAFQAATEINKAKKEWIIKEKGFPFDAEHISLPELQKMLGNLEFAVMSTKFSKDKRISSFLAAAGQEFDQSLKSVLGEEKIKSLEQSSAILKAIEGGIEGATFGVSEVIKKQVDGDVTVEQGVMKYRGMPIGQEYTSQEAQLTAMAFGGAGKILGSFPTYAAVAGQVGKALQLSNPAMKVFATKHPFLFGAGVSNPIEETIEAAIRKGTGQEYGMRDFIAGIVMGTVFEAGIAGIRKLPQAKTDAALNEMDIKVKEATTKKGSVLSHKELLSEIGDIKITGSKTVEDMFSTNKKAYEKTAESRLGMPKDDIDAEQIFTESKIVSPAERAVLTEQAVKSEAMLPLEAIDRAFRKKGPGATSEDVLEAIHGSIDNPKGKPMDPEFEKEFGALRQQIIDTTSKWTKMQQNADILDTKIDDDKYLRTFLVGLDGKPASDEAMGALRRFTNDPSLTKRLFAMNSKGGQFGVSNRYNQSRKFENADGRDAWLAKNNIPLKTDRNVLRVMWKTGNQVANMVSRKVMLDTIRKQAQQKIKGAGVEVYNPDIIRKFKDNQRDVIKQARNDILDEARTKKLINVNDWKAAKENTKRLIDSKKVDLEANPSKDWVKQAKKDLDQEFRVIKAEMFEDLKVNRGKINDLAKQRIERVRDVQAKEWSRRLNDMDLRLENLKKKGWKEATKDGNQVSQLRGILFPPKEAATMARIFQTTKRATPLIVKGKNIGSFSENWSDFTKAWKAFRLTFDLFKVLDVVKTAYTVRGIKGFADIGLDPLKNIDNVVDATRHGLSVKRPSDIELGAVTDEMLGKGLLDDMEKTITERAIKKGLELGGKVPVLGHLGRLGLKLEKLQWDMLVPATKLKMWNNLWPSYKKTYKNITVEEAKVLASRNVNNAMQGQNWEALIAKNPLVTKDFQNRIRVLFLGPDKLLSNLGKIAGPFKSKGALYRRQWVRSVLTGLAMTELANQLLNGHSMFQNRRGNELSVQIPWIKDRKGNPLAVDLAGSLLDSVKFMDRPGSFFANKLHPLSRLPVKLIAGEVDPFEEANNEIPIPLAIEGLLRGAIQEAKPDVKPSTGTTGLKNSAIASLLDFSGLPNYFRGGGSGHRGLSRARFGDLISGNASLSDWILSKEIEFYRNPQEYAAFLQDEFQSGMRTEQEVASDFKKYQKKYDENVRFESTIRFMMDSNLPSEEFEKLTRSLQDEFDFSRSEIKMFQAAKNIVDNPEQLQGENLDNYFTLLQQQHSDTKGKQGINEAQSNIVRKWLAEDWKIQTERSGLLNFIPKEGTPTF